MRSKEEARAASMREPPSSPSAHGIPFLEHIHANFFFFGLIPSFSLTLAAVDRFAFAEKKEEKTVLSLREIQEEELRKAKQKAEEELQARQRAKPTTPPPVSAAPPVPLFRFFSLSLYFLFPLLIRDIVCSACRVVLMRRGRARASPSNRRRLRCARYSSRSFSPSRKPPSRSSRTHLLALSRHSQLRVLSLTCCRLPPRLRLPRPPQPPPR